MKRLAAVALAAALAVACTPTEATTRPTSEEKTSKPQAAMISFEQETVTGAVIRQLEVVAFTNAYNRAVLEAIDAALPKSAPEYKVSNSPSTSRSSSGAGNPNFLECTKQIESRGDYGAVSSGGTYRGAYQFHQNTWNNTAEQAGRPDLVGADPATASPGDQDAMASSLYASQGNRPWGGRC
jgi:hypothetical protein